MRNVLITVAAIIWNHCSPISPRQFISPILAAKRAGITDIILSGDNRKDVDDINSRYRDGLTFHFVETVPEVISLALTDERAVDAINL